MPDHRRLLLISVLVLTALFFLHYLVLQEYLPEYIPETPIKVGGAYLFVCYVVVYYVVFKRILKQDDSISLTYLIIFGSLIALFSEVIFQFYRLTTFSYMTDGEKTWHFAKSLLISCSFATILAFSTAFDLKYKFWWARWVSTIIGVGLMFAFKYAAEYLGLLNN